MRKVLSIVLKMLIGVSSLLGVVLACVFAVRDGYSQWFRRMFYFTQQSNVWIGVTCLVMGILLIVGIVKGKDYVKNYMYVCKYIFTVSITITGLIFCGLLAPFADYNVWVFSSVLTHVVVPVLAIADFFVDDYKIDFKRFHIFLTLIPPFAWFVFASVLCLAKVDFGKGEAYPYFFMNYFSEVGMFGFKNTQPRPEIGSFYWILFILGLILLIGFVYYKIRILIQNKWLKNKE